MKTIFSCSTIAGVAAAVPAGRLDLSTLASEWGERNVANIIQSTGITHVREAPPGMTAADLCEAAARSLLSALGVEPGEIDGIVFVSQTPDHIMPATSAILQHRLQLERRVAAFDVSYGCSGYVYSLLQADLLIGSGLCRSVLVCAGDTTTRVVNPRDRALKMLFGDGGSATLVVQGNDPHAYSVRTDGSGARSLIIPAGGARQPRSATTCVARAAEDGNVRSEEDLYMDGIAVLYMALRDVPEAIDEAVALAGWTRSDVSFFGLHQANRFMTDYLAKKLRAAPGAVPFGAADVGNTGPASIPVLLAREHSRLAAEGRLQRSVLCGFGVGFSVAAMTVPLAHTTFLNLIELE
ncbi:MAG: ketoacyl-ACP synthase III [Pseudomonadota bacterium]|nr:ketoacyl-ACP synthase III [Pseudomonadota bacterium]